MEKARNRSWPWLANEMAPPRVGPTQGLQTAPSIKPPRNCPCQPSKVLRRNPASARPAKPAVAKAKPEEAWGDKQDQAENHHHHGPSLGKAVFGQAHQMARGDHRETQGHEGKPHPRSQGQRAPATGLQRTRQNDGQDRQDTGVNQGQKPRTICQDNFHGPVMRSDARLVIRQIREHAVTPRPDAPEPIARPKCPPPRWPRPTHRPSLAPRPKEGPRLPHRRLD